MKICLVIILNILLVYSSFSLATKNTTNTVLVKLNELSMQLNVQNSTSTTIPVLSPIERITKMRKKKEIIINLVYEYTPLIGELLALSNIEKINLIATKFFILKERAILKNFLIMWDPNSSYLDQSAKVLLNMIICNTNFNQLRCILNFLLEGLTKGDETSILMFKEIVTTVLIDTFIRTKFYYFNDIQAKGNLIRTFNKGLFKFTPIEKLRFIEEMFLSDKLKEMLTFIVMKYKTKEEVDIQMKISLQTVPIPLTNNTKLFSFNPQEVTTGKDVLTNIQREVEAAVEASHNIATLDETQLALRNMKMLVSDEPSAMRFKESMAVKVESEVPYAEVKEENANYLPEKLIVKLDDIKNKLKDEYVGYMYNQTQKAMPLLEENSVFQVGLGNRSIYPKYKRHIQNLIKLNEMLDPFPLELGKGSVEISEPSSESRNVKTTVKTEVAPGLNVEMQFKEKETTKEEKVDYRFKEKETSLYSQSNFATESLNELQKNFNSKIKDKIIEENSNVHVTDLLKKDNIEVFFPKEIHSTEQIERTVNKTITVDDSKKIFFI